MTLPASSRRVGILLALLLAVAACAPAAGTGAGPSAAPPAGSPSGGSPTAGAPASGVPRPSSPAVVAITQPAVGATLTGPKVHVVITLTGAQIVQATTTAVRPDQGHVHLYVNNQLYSMNYALEDDLTLQPGTYVLKAEFVASDHVPFNPRVWSSEVYFTVTG
jgi:hypothetical protein